MLRMIIVTKDLLKQSQECLKANFKVISALITAVFTCSLPSGYNIGVINTPQKVSGSHPVE